MLRNTVLCAAIIGASAVLTSSAVATANPATSMQTIESSAAQLCGAIDRSPNRGGVLDGILSLDDSGLDDIDGALVLITAVHHVCPQHEGLITDAMDSFAGEEACTKQT
jgi:hypothetical protein